ncbi:flagellar hook-length control protein FliK [Salmonella enterica]
MIIKNSPELPARDINRKTSATTSGQTEEQFTSALEKQLSSTQAQHGEESGKVTLAKPGQKRPAASEENPVVGNVELVAALLQAEPQIATADNPLMSVDLPVADTLQSADIPTTAPIIDIQLPQVAIAQTEELSLPAADALTLSTIQQIETAASTSYSATHSPLNAELSSLAKEVAQVIAPVQESKVQSGVQKPLAAQQVIPQTTAVHTEKGGDAPEASTAMMQKAEPTAPQVAEKHVATTESFDTALHTIKGESVPNTGVMHSAAPVPTTPATTTTGMTPAITTATLAAEVGTPAWQSALGQHIATFTRGGVHHAELRLHPEELGALQISLRMNNDQAQVHFVTEHHHVRAALESAMPQLRTMLAESGIALGQSSVGADTASSNSSPFGDASGHEKSEKESADISAPITEEPTILRSVVVYATGINTFA